MTMVARAAAAAAQPLKFPRERRLRTPADFKRVYAQGRRISNEFFTANTQPNQLPLPRLGMSVAVRTMGGAVERNRLRRMIRESFRLHQTLVLPLDIVVGVRSTARAAPSAELRAGLEQLWRQLGRTPT
ncbi:MAG TPA: ribonuclease P protein component [Steroidobacteraceae bacterium]|jgi:ribonuclease P protein component